MLFARSSSRSLFGSLVNEDVFEAFEDLEGQLDVQVEVVVDQQLDLGPDDRFLDLPLRQRS